MKPQIILSTCFLLAALGSGLGQNTFTQVTTGPLVNDTELFVGAVWGDFNGDGWPDVSISVYGGTNALYLNDGTGGSSRIIGQDPAQEVDSHTVPAAADIDNDGWLDLIVPAGDGAPAARPCRLYHNTGNGSFNWISGGAFGSAAAFFDNASWVDYDNDGFVDLFLENSGASGVGGNNLLFHNNRDGTFSRVTTGPLVSDIGVGFGALWSDYDNDGYMDLFVININNNSRGFLYHNNRNGSFTKVLTNVVATDLWPSGAAGGTWGDYDNDGLPDLFVAGGDGVSRLYHNNGNGAFTNVISGPMLRPAGITSCRGAAWGDYDNDGYLDLFVVSSPGPNGLYRNNGDGTFTQILTEPPATDASGAYSQNALAWVDYDNDGFLDLFMSRATAGAGPASNQLYHNNGNGNGWLEVKLTGTLANRSGIGAKVRVHATIGGKTFWQLREITSGASWDCHPMVAHFGLGDATNVDTVRIEWPWPSGTVQELHDIAPRQILTIAEPPRLLAGSTNGVPQFALRSWPGLRYGIQASTDLTNWTEVSTVTVTNASGVNPIADPNPPDGRPRFYRAVSR